MVLGPVEEVESDGGNHHLLVARRGTSLPDGGSSRGGGGGGGGGGSEQVVRGSPRGAKTAVEPSPAPAASLAIFDAFEAELEGVLLESQRVHRQVCALPLIKGSRYTCVREEEEKYATT